MKKKKINKTRIKIFIALTLMFTLITTIFIGTKTFAYETDRFSYTINTITANSNNIDVSLNNNVYTITNNTTGTGLNISLNLNETKSYFNNNYLFINYVLYKSTNGVTYNVFENNPGASNGSGTQFNCSYYLNNSSSGASRVSNFQNFHSFYSTTKGFYSNIIPLYTANNGSDFDFDVFGMSASTNLLGSNYWKVEIYNVDIVGKDEIGLPQYYDTYYSQIESNYNQLLDDYENLQDDYNELYSEWSQLDDDFGELQDEYNELQSNYNDLTNTDTNGLWANFGVFNIGYTNENNEYQALESYQTFENFKNSQYNYLNGIEINLSNLKNRYPNIDKFIFSSVTYNPSVRILLNSLSYKINNDGNTCTNGIVLDSITNTIDIDYTKLIQMDFKVNYQNIYDNIGYYDENKYVSILMFQFEYNNSNNFSITSLNNEYNAGYVVGYQKGKDSRNAYINSLDERINNLVQDINRQQIVINSLNEQIEAFNSDYNLNNLMWTIGATPFESFKQIWNVNFFGVNISEFILGFITTFIGLYVLKKFFF